MTIEQQPYVQVWLFDDSDSRASLRLHVQAGASRAAGLAAALQLANLADNASGCSAVDLILRYPVRIAPGASPAPGANRFHTGVLIFETDTANQYAIIEIPGIKPSLIDPLDSNALLLTAPELQNYINALISGIFTSPFGYNLTACIAGIYELRQ